MVIIENSLIAIFILIGLVTSIETITYNVIADPPQSMDVVVLVDNVAYPLKAEHGILYKGEAPSAKDGYTYAYIDNNNFKISESFTRPPLEGESSSTFNEFFNRSINVYNIKSLPQVLPPLECIHRIGSDLHRQNQIPTIHIYGDQSSIDTLHRNQTAQDLDIKLNIAYIGLKDVQVFENVKVALAGRSTRWVSKLSYTFKFNKKDDRTLFGFKNFKLRSLAKDDSYIRETLSYNALKSAGVPASGFSYIRLFINNQPAGLYGLIETFQDPWTAAEFGDGDSDYKSGHMYQGYGIRGVSKSLAFVSDLHYEGTDIQRYNFGQYKVKIGPKKKKVESYKELQDFTKFISDSIVNKASPSEWEKRLDVNGFLRAMALTDLLGLIDSYVSASNNFYLYKHPRQEGRFTYIPADMDTSFGSTFLYNVSTLSKGSYADFPGMMFRPLSKAVLSYSDYLKSYNDLRVTLTKNLVNPDVMNPYIDSIIDMIRADVEWDAGLKRVGKSKPPTNGRKNITNVYEKIKQFVPPGYVFDFLIESPPDVPLDIAVGGDYPPNTFYSVKKFIAKKSSAVLQFYNNE